MEDMDIEQVVEVPDTPDRITARHINATQLGKESNSLVAGHPRTSDFRVKESLNQLRASRQLCENGCGRKYRLNPQRIPFKMDEFEPRNKSIAFSSSENSYPSHDASLSRRGAVVNDSKPETWHSTGMQLIDKGKAECTKNPPKSHFFMDNDALFDMAFPHTAPKALQAEKPRDVQLSANGGSSIHFSPTISSSSFKGKEKVGVSSCNGSGSAINHGKGIDLSDGCQPIFDKQMSDSHISVTSPRVTGHKKLVRNGCISPHNIATRTQRLSEGPCLGCTDVGLDHSINLISGSPSAVDIREIIMDENSCYRAKGKGLVIHPATSKEHDTKIIASTSSRTNNKAADEITGANRDVLLGGWRSTRNRAKPIYYPVDDGYDDYAQDEKRAVRRNNGNGNGNVTVNTCNSGVRDEPQTASGVVSRLNQRNQPHHIGNTHTKRQRNYGLTSRTQSEFSSVVPDDSEILFLGSSEESSSSRSSRNMNRRHQGNLDPIYEIDDEVAPERRHCNSQGLGSVNDESDARARQVEADEMLARELQEQLYHEMPVFEGIEIDENIAWALQQEENTFRTTSSQNRTISRPGSSSPMRANRQPQLRSIRNPSNRRGAQVRVPATRTSQLRNRLFRRSSAALSRSRNPSLASLSTARNFQFPLGMDLDVRLDILEALEDGVGEFSDMSMTSRILQVQRDFNENDYEMLLALDENNHQHGTSVNRINSLPESIVKTDNFEETCAICLETPAMGETIRHLPCLHKFHKDCIDPWLSRRTSCPVCKSSIT